MFITEALRGSISLLESDLCWHKLEAEIFSFLGIIYDLFILLHVMKLNHKQVTRMTFNISTLDIEVACTHFEIEN